MSDKLTSHPLTFDKLEEMTKEIIVTCHDIVPGHTEEEKKRWCIFRLKTVLEFFDNYIPIIGAFLDTPIVDDIEGQAVSLLVDWVWDKVKHK